MGFFSRLFGRPDNSPAEAQVTLKVTIDREEKALKDPVAQQEQKAQQHPDPAQDPKAQQELYIVTERIAYSQNQPPLTRELMDRFGGHGFLFNLRMWEARIGNGPVVCFVTKDDHYRRRFDVLERTGVALHGKNVPLELRFRGLPMATIREAANQLRAGKFRTKDEGARVVAAASGAEEWWAARYRLEDVFLLQPEEWSPREVETLWATYRRQAKEMIERKDPAHREADAHW